MKAALTGLIMLAVPTQIGDGAYRSGAKTDDYGVGGGGIGTTEVFHTYNGGGGGACALPLNANPNNYECTAHGGLIEIHRPIATIKLTLKGRTIYEFPVPECTITPCGVIIPIDGLPR